MSRRQVDLVIAKCGAVGLGVAVPEVRALDAVHHLRPCLRLQQFEKVQSLALIIAINPWLALAELVTEIVVVAITRYMSVGSIIASFAFPILTAILYPGRENYPLFVITAVLAGLLSLYRHKENIKRLRKGEENRLDFDRISRISEKVMKRMQDRKERKNQKN